MIKVILTTIVTMVMAYIPCSVLSGTLNWHQWTDTARGLFCLVTLAYPIGAQLYLFTNPKDTGSGGSRSW